ncbi:hypothetical protein [Legionella birminghamensis]|nr:hypothetical protein [Legionella birminghamensis]
MTDEVYLDKLKKVNTLEELLEIRLHKALVIGNILLNRGDFNSILNSYYQQLQIDIKQNEFIEYCIFQALDCLISSEFSRQLSLLFNADFIMNGLLLTISLRDEYKQSDSSLGNLKKLVDDLNQALSDTKWDEEKSFSRLENTNSTTVYVFNFQKIFALRLFLANPLSTAVFLIDNEDKIENKSFIISSCEFLIEKIKPFRGLAGGPDNNTINEIIEKLLVMKHPVLTGLQNIKPSRICIKKSTYETDEPNLDVTAENPTAAATTGGIAENENSPPPSGFACFPFSCFFKKRTVNRNKQSEEFTFNSANSSGLQNN